MVAPIDMGLPPKFQNWRPVQEDAINHWGKERFTIQVTPTGVGKSLIYIAGALKRCDKTTILTSTKGLQDQLVRDFSDIGLVEVRGRKNYLCVRGDGPSADDGLCHYGLYCQYKNGGCPYYDAIKQAAQARYVVTNYAMWLTASEFLNSSKVLIMDEAHSASDHLDSYLTTSINLVEISEVLEREIRPPKHWGDWLWSVKPEVDGLVEDGLKRPDLSLKRLRRLIKVKRVLDSLHRIVSDAIVVELVNGVYKVSPLYIGYYAEEKMFRGIPSILLTSATVTQYDAKRLGINDYAYREFPSVFPLRNRPVIFLPTVKVDRNIEKGEEMLWLSRIEAILKARQDRKGIIHAVSYDRAIKVFNSIKPKATAMRHGAHDTAIAVRKFKNAEPPKVLVSPSVTTGWDFPYDECEYQIIAKVPFPDGRSLVQQERAKIDPDLPRYQAWQSIVQAAGRGVRAEDDRCETIIIDDHFKWLNGRYGHLAPNWFREAISTAMVLPAPPEKLNGRRRQER